MYLQTNRRRDVIGWRAVCRSCARVRALLAGCGTCVLCMFEADALGAQSARRVAMSAQPVARWRLVIGWRVVVCRRCGRVRAIVARCGTCALRMCEAYALCAQSARRIAMGAQPVAMWRLVIGCMCGACACYLRCVRCRREVMTVPPG